MTVPEIIKSEKDIEAAIPVLLQREPRFGEALAVVDHVPLRLRRQGFETLLHAIVGQQVSTDAAAAIWSRLEVAGLTEETAVLRSDLDMLRACGLSKPKADYALAIARARVDWRGLNDLENQSAISTLMDLRGVGRWTAEIYVKFALGRADVFAAGDLALQEAAKLLFGLPMRPSEKDLRQMALGWAPVRAVAARILWAYYRFAKDREGIR